MPGGKSSSISGLYLSDASRTHPTPAVTIEMSPQSVRPAGHKIPPELRATAPQTVLGLTLTPWWVGEQWKWKTLDPRGPRGPEAPPATPPKAARLGRLVRRGSEETAGPQRPPRRLGGLRPTRGGEEGTAGIAPLLSRDLGRELLDGRSVSPSFPPPPLLPVATPSLSPPRADDSDCFLALAAAGRERKREGAQHVDLRLRRGQSPECPNSQVENSVHRKPR